jgi:hypothetical protein
MPYERREGAGKATPRRAVITPKTFSCLQERKTFRLHQIVLDPIFNVRHAREESHKRLAMPARAKKTPLALSQKLKPEPKPLEVRLSNRALGSGAEGVVLEGLARDGRLFAVKKVRDQPQARAVLELWQRLSHPHILPLLEAHPADRHLLLYTELLEGGSV